MPRMKEIIGLSDWISTTLPETYACDGTYINDSRASYATSTIRDHASEIQCIKYEQEGLSLADCGSPQGPS